MASSRVVIEITNSATDNQWRQSWHLSSFRLPSVGTGRTVYSATKPRNASWVSTIDLASSPTATIIHHPELAGDQMASSCRKKHNLPPPI